MNILYIHGYGSNANSTTGRILQQELGNDYNVVTYDFDNDYAKFGTLLKNIKTAKKLIKTHNINIVVASSMGAFIAMNLSGIYKILINPCMLPHEHMPNIIPIHNELEIEKYRNFANIIPIDIEDKLYTFGMFASDDELFSYKDLFTKKYRSQNIISMSGGHRITAYNIKDKLVSLIKTIEGIFLNEDINNESDILLERYVTAISENDRLQYIDDVWKILELSYKDIGGTKYIAANKQELVKDTNFWKMVRRNGKIVAVQIYTTKRGGRKVVAGGSDGTQVGKDALYSIMKEDMKMLDRNAWAEVSGAVEYITLNKIGFVPIPSKIAAEIMKDKIFTDFHEDGYHYTRIIGNKPITKIMVGNFTGKI